MLITKKLAIYYKLLHFATLFTFVSVVSCQFISFITKMEVVARITSSRLVFSGLLHGWDRIDLVNVSLRSEWNATLCQ